MLTTELPRMQHNMMPAPKPCHVMTHLIKVKNIQHLLQVCIQMSLYTLKHELSFRP